MSRKAKAAEFIDQGYTVYVTGRNVQITDSLHAYALDKLSKIERFNVRIVEIDITMDVQREDHMVDIVAKIDHLKIRSEATTSNMYASIDLAIDKLQSQLRKYRSRICDHHAKKITATDVNVNVLENEYDLDEINDEIDGENEKEFRNQYNPPNIAQREIHSLKTLSTQEALMSIDLSGDNFMIFRSEEDQKLKVIYKRNDGNYGIIEPEK